MTDQLKALLEEMRSKNDLPDFLYKDYGNIKIGYHGDTIVTDEWNKWKESQLTFIIEKLKLILKQEGK